MVLPKMKSAKPRYRLMPPEWSLLAVLTWSIRQADRRKDPMQEMNLARKALKGKVPTRQQ
jgi:hypothetical protein